MIVFVLYVLLYYCCIRVNKKKIDNLKRAQETQILVMGKWETARNPVKNPAEKDYGPEV